MGKSTKEAIKNEVATLLLATLPINFFCINREGYLIDCNDRLVEHSKVSSEDEILGKHLLELAVPEAWQNCQKVMSEDQSMTVEEAVTHPDGTEQVFLSIKSPMHDDAGEVIGLIGIGIDITEKKQAEKRAWQAKQQADAEKIKAKAESEMRRAVTILAGSIAHDLRTPLSSLSLINNLFEKSLYQVNAAYQSLSHGEQENRIAIGEQLKTLQTFPVKFNKIATDMNNFIDVTLKYMKKVATGTLSREDFEACEIEPSIHEVISTYPFRKNEKEMVHLDLSENFTFMGSPVVFYRILFNLIGNSLQQIEKNQGGKLFIQTERKGNMNYVRVKDTAGGASKAVAAHLFDGYKSTKNKGTGVGLAFCKLAMKSFSGDITCHTIEGDSIEFVLSFPCANDDTFSQAHQSA